MIFYMVPLNFRGTVIVEENAPWAPNWATFRCLGYSFLVSLSPTACFFLVVKVILQEIIPVSGSQ